MFERKKKAVGLLGNLRALPTQRRSSTRKTLSTNGSSGRVEDQIRRHFSMFMHATRKRVEKTLLWGASLGKCSQPDRADYKLNCLASLIGVIAREIACSRARKRRSIRIRRRRCASDVAPMFLSNFCLTSGYLLANFERPVLGCIDAECCKVVLV